jgi:hypothetical protein
LATYLLEPCIQVWRIFLKFGRIVAIENLQKKHLFLPLFIFQFHILALYIYIYIYIEPECEIYIYIYIYIYSYLYRCNRSAKKEGIGSLVVNNPPPTRPVAGNGPTRAVRWQWSGRPSWFSGGTIRFLSAETRLRSSAGPAAACSKLPSSSPTRLPLKTGGSLVESSKESYI